MRGKTRWERGTQPTVLLPAPSLTKWLQHLIIMGEAMCLPPLWDWEIPECKI